MRRQKTYSGLTLLILILFGILLPLGLGVKDPVYIAISFTLVWAICSLILLGYVFLVVGRHKRNKSKRRKEEDPFPHHLIQEWEALWKITAGEHKDPGMGNPDWN